MAPRRPEDGVQTGFEPGSNWVRTGFEPGSNRVRTEAESPNPLAFLRFGCLFALKLHFSEQSSDYHDEAPILPILATKPAQSRGSNRVRTGFELGLNRPNLRLSLGFGAFSFGNFIFQNKAPIIMAKLLPYQS